MRQDLWTDPRRDVRSGEGHGNEDRPRTPYRPRLRTAMMLAVCSVSGCGGWSADTAVDALPDAPESFVSDGRTWKKAFPMGDADETLLLKFFEIRSEFQGSPELDGPPTAYSCGPKDRRFYWVRPASNDCSWTCIHFENGKFGITQGHENPYTH